MVKCPMNIYVESMVTAQNPPRTGTGIDAAARPERAKVGERSRRRPARTVVRGAGVILDAAWRVVLLGGEVSH